MNKTLSIVSVLFSFSLFACAFDAAPSDETIGDRVVEETADNTALPVDRNVPSNVTRAGRITQIEGSVSHPETDMARIRGQAEVPQYDLDPTR